MIDIYIFIYYIYVSMEECFSNLARNCSALNEKNCLFNYVYKKDPEGYLHRSS